MEKDDKINPHHVLDNRSVWHSIETGNHLSKYWYLKERAAYDLTIAAMEDYAKEWKEKYLALEAAHTALKGQIEAEPKQKTT